MSLTVTPSAIARHETVQLKAQQLLERSHDSEMKVRLTRKFADLINGIDLSKAHTGETLELSQREAELLLAEGWAEYEGGSQPRERAHESPPPVVRRRSKKKR